MTASLPATPSSSNSPRPCPPSVGAMATSRCNFKSAGRVKRLYLYSFWTGGQNAHVMKEKKLEQETTWYYSACYRCTYKNSVFRTNATICLDVNYKSRLTYHCHFSKPILGTPVITSESCTALCCPDCQTISHISSTSFLVRGQREKLNLLGLCCTTQQMEHLCTDDSYIVGNRTLRTPPAVTSVPNIIFFPFFLGLNCFFSASGWIQHKTECVTNPAAPLKATAFVVSCHNGAPASQWLWLSIILPFWMKSNCSVPCY